MDGGLAVLSSRTLRPCKRPRFNARHPQICTAPTENVGPFGLYSPSSVTYSGVFPCASPPRSADDKTDHGRAIITVDDNDNDDDRKRRQTLNILTYALGINALALHLHRQRQAPPLAA